MLIVYLCSSVSISCKLYNLFKSILESIECIYLDSYVEKVKLKSDEELNKYNGSRRMHQISYSVYNNMINSTQIKDFNHYRIVKRDNIDYKNWQYDSNIWRPNGPRDITISDLHSQ